MFRHYITNISLALFAIVYLVSSAGAETWKPYDFKGSEHFKYSIKSIDGDQEKTGHFTLDLKKIEENKFKVSYSSALGDNESSSTTTTTADEMAGKIMMSLMMSGSEAGAVLGSTLFTPMLGMMFMGGADLEVGSGWSRTEEGKKMSFKIEAKEKIAGQEGYRCVFREGDNLKYMQVISPEIGLPLRTEVVEDDGKRFISELIEFSK